MYRGFFISLTVALLTSIPVFLYSQESSKELEEKRKKIQAEIEYTNKLINQTKQSKEATLNELGLVKSRINQRNELVATLKKEISQLDYKIESTEIGIKRLNTELKNLKQEYAKVISFAYKHQSAQNYLIYIFSAEDLNQSYQRLRYLDQISDYIRKEADNIREKEKIKEKELRLYNDQILEKKKLLEAENVQMAKLEQEKAEKNSLTKKLSGQEKQLTKALKEKENESARLKKKIEEIIAAEIKARSANSKGEKYSLTPEERLLSDSFANNKGKLPWPIDRGMISETFGVHTHPVLANVKTKNNGVDIATSDGGEARSIFSGKVVSVATITNTNKAVIIRHGEYFTVYSNLVAVYVSIGDEVSTKELIGKVYTNPKGITELHFEVWKGKELQNPEFWILKD